VNTIDWPPPRQPRRRGRLLLVGAIALVLFGGGTALSYYVESLWFESLGFAEVFWKTLRFQSLIFTSFTLVTFLLLYAAYFALKPARLDLTSGPILINGQPLRLPVEPVLRLIALVATLFLTSPGHLSR